MGRSCLKFTALSSLGIGFAVGSFAFLRRGNVRLATRMAFIAGIGSGALANLLCQTKKVSKDISNRESYWEYKKALDERLKKKYEQIK